MKIVLVRHGMTPGNALRRYIGKTDDPLSDEGRRLARDAGGDAALDRVYVTPLVRTQQTAAILFPNAEQVIVDGLREMDFGVFENRSADEMEQDAVYRAWVDANCEPACPEGESMEGFAQRVCEAFEELIRSLHEQGKRLAVFVVHGGTVMAVLQKFARPEMGFYDCLMKNCEAVYCTLSTGEDGLPFTLTDIVRMEKIKL
ncbi:MAG: histidine phosphatase family protein [Oscillospiraceae bacterium]|nr:histidine phosphatase family protein [Oscillospiraceae bacterium]